MHDGEAVGQDDDDDGEAVGQHSDDDEAVRR